MIIIIVLLLLLLSLLYVSILRPNTIISIIIIIEAQYWGEVIRLIW